LPTVDRKIFAFLHYARLLGKRSDRGSTIYPAELYASGGAKQAGKSFF
jgi:hypothetical protein